MGYTGNFETKKECLEYFIRLMNASYSADKRGKISIRVYNYQDIVLTEDNGEKVYYCLLYHYDQGEWRFKYMDHSVGPNPEDTICPKAVKDFLSNPAYKTGEFAKEFIKDLQTQRGA